MTNALTLRDNLAPTNFDQVATFAEKIARTPFAPKDYQNKPESIVAAVVYGADLGFTPMQALQNIAVVNGKPSVYGDGLRALVLGRSDCEGIEDGYDGTGDDYRAWVTVRRKGKSPVTRTFSARDAKAAGLLDKPGPWKQYRDRMLLMRAQGFAIRDAYADVLRGIITQEEAADFQGFDNAKDVTPRSSGWTHDATTLEPEPQEPIVHMTDVNGEVHEVKQSRAVEAWQKLADECTTASMVDALAHFNNVDIDARNKRAQILRKRRDALIPRAKTTNDLMLELCTEGIDAAMALAAMSRAEYREVVENLTPGTQDIITIRAALAKIDDVEDPDAMIREAQAAHRQQELV